MILSYAQATSLLQTANFSNLIDKLVADSVERVMYPIIGQRIEKASPTNLAQELNSGDNAAGATIMIQTKEDTGAGPPEFIKISNGFFLNGFQYSFKEKAQVIETFGSSFVSFFGDSVKVYSFTGNAIDYPSTGKTSAQKAITMQQSSLTDLYQNHLRGSLLVEKGHIAVMKVLNHSIYGYPISMTVNYSANADKISSFNMS